MIDKILVIITISASLDLLSRIVCDICPLVMYLLEVGID